MPKPAQTPQPMMVANVMSPANSSAAAGPQKQHNPKKKSTNDAINDVLDRKLKEQKKRVFDLNEMHKHLDQLTSEDEHEIKKKSPRTQEQWEIKRQIKIAFRREEMPPSTDLQFYKIGRLLGKGAFGKVNLAL